MYPLLPCDVGKAGTIMPHEPIGELVNEPGDLQAATQWEVGVLQRGDHVQLSVCDGEVSLNWSATTSQPATAHAVRHHSKCQTTSLSPGGGGTQYVQHSSFSMCWCTRAECRTHHCHLLKQYGATPAPLGQRNHNNTVK